MSKCIKVSLDVGYDGVKIAIEDGNKVMVHRYPSELLSSRTKELPEVQLGNAGAEDIIYKAAESSERYAVGALAVRGKAGRIGQIDFTDDLRKVGPERFQSMQFRILALTSIAAMLVQNGIEDNIDIDLLVAVPHKYLNHVANDVCKNLSGHHALDMQVGEVKKTVTYNVVNVQTASQAILALVSYAYDSDGNICNLEENDYPVLISDCGYGTCGLVVVENGMLIDDTMSESNEEYTMMRVNMNTAAAINDYIGKQGYYSCQDIEERMSSRRDIDRIARYRSDRTGNYEELDIVSYFKEQLNAVVDSEYNHIQKCFRPERIRKVLVAGGCGKAFYPVLQSKMTASHMFTENQVVLNIPEYKGVEYNIVYGVAIGGLKLLNVL